MELPNITLITDDENFVLSDSRLSNKTFAKNFDKNNYLKHRNHFILSLAEEHILEKQVINLKNEYYNKKNILELQQNETKKYKANLIELDIQNTSMMQTDVNQIIENQKIYAEKLRNNECSICKSLIFGKPKSIYKLANNQIGKWIYIDKPNNPCKLICNHIYHSNCISTWFKKKNSCPMCRQRIELWSLIDHDNHMLNYSSDDEIENEDEDNNDNNPVHI